MPGFVRSLLTLIGSRKSINCSNNKSGQISKALSFLQSLCYEIYSVRVRCLEKLCSLFINIAFFTNVIDLQAALSACLTARNWEMLSEAVEIPENFMPLAFARLTSLSYNTNRMVAWACRLIVNPDWLMRSLLRIQTLNESAIPSFNLNSLEI